MYLTFCHSELLKSRGVEGPLLVRSRNTSTESHSLPLDLSFILNRYILTMKHLKGIFILLSGAQKMSPRPWFRLASDLC